MLQQVHLYSDLPQKTIQTTCMQDLDPRPCTDNVHASHITESSVELMMIVCLFHFGRFGLDLQEPTEDRDQSRCTNSGLIGSTHCTHQFVTFFSMIRMVIICNLPKLNQRIHRFMTGLRISWVPFLVRWVTELTSTKLLRRLVKNGVILR